MGPGRMASLSASSPCTRYRCRSAKDGSLRLTAVSESLQADGTVAMIRYADREGRGAVSSVSRAERNVSRAPDSEGGLSLSCCSCAFGGMTWRAGPEDLRVGIQVVTLVCRCSAAYFYFAYTQIGKYGELPTVYRDDFS